MEGNCVFKQEINHARIFKTHICFISGRMRGEMKGEDTEGMGRRRRG